MIGLLFFLIPICSAGIAIFRSVISNNRFEIILPAGTVIGLLIFTFFLNMVSFVFKGSTGIIISYALFTLLGLTVFLKQRRNLKIYFNLFQDRLIFFWAAPTIIWGGFFYWKVAHALIGSDTNLYYSIAHSFIKGNFPPMTPWQPDIPLSYHVGASELLGAFHFFTGLNFQFLHLFFSFLFIFCNTQIIIWLIKRHQDLTSFLIANLAVVATFISYGFFYITWPIFPLHLPELRSINQAVLWLRELPTVNQSIEVYGAPINLDGLIYFIFHAFGLAAFLSLMALLLYIKKGSLGGWLTLCVSLAALALVNESIFIAAFPALVIGMLLIEYKERTLWKNLKGILILLILTVIMVFYQGGIISTTINPFSTIESSADIFPKKEDIKGDFLGYHLGQEISKLLPAKPEWLPLRWFHVGIDLLLPVCFLVLLIPKWEFRQSVLLKILFIAAVTSLGAYHFIVPKFLVANGNRFLSASFLFFSLLLLFTLIFIWERLNKNFLKKILLLILAVWILFPTILPPLALLSKTRFGENKLIPKKEVKTTAIKWIEGKLSLNNRIAVLDARSPHPSGQSRAMVQAGVFAPIFPGDVRVYTIEASPEYFDMAYFLSPAALQKLKIDTLLIDNIFFETLPEIRKQQLKDSKYFEKIFEYSSDENNWEKVYKINERYLKAGREIDGTFFQLGDIFQTPGRIYIDNEENFNPSYLRRAIIFNLRDRDIYYLPQSGVYLNVEAEINFHPPRDDSSYDYLILGRNTNPQICKCQTKLIWTGLKDEILVWKKID